MRNILSKISSSLILLIGVVVVGILVFLSAGLRPMYVVSGSMEPSFYKGDLLLKASNDLVEANPGDVIAFEAPWLSNKIVTHRLMSLEDGMMITKGDNNTSVDPEISADNIVGVIVAKIPYAGWAIMPWTIRGLAVVALGLIGLDYFLKFLKFRKSSKIINSNLSPTIVALREGNKNNS